MVRFGYISLRPDDTGNYTEAADYTRLWNHLRESISLVKGGILHPGQGVYGLNVSDYDAGYYG